MGSTPTGSPTFAAAAEDAAGAADDADATAVGFEGFGERLMCEAERKAVVGDVSDTST